VFFPLVFPWPRSAPTPLFKFQNRRLLPTYTSDKSVPKQDFRGLIMHFDFHPALLQMKVLKHTKKICRLALSVMYLGVYRKKKQITLQ